MSVAKCRSALVSAFTESPAIIASDKLFHENREGDTPLTGLWCVLEFDSAPQTPVTLGNAGEDEASGKLTAHLSYPLNTGSGMANAAIDSLNQRFYAGKTFTFGGQTVRVDSVGVGNSYPIQNAHRTPYIINWSARIKRQTT